MPRSLRPIIVVTWRPRQPREVREFFVAINRKPGVTIEQVTKRFGIHPMTRQCCRVRKHASARGSGRTIKGAGVAEVDADADADADDNCPLHQPSLTICPTDTSPSWLPKLAEVSGKTRQLRQMETERDEAIGQG